LITDPGDLNLLNTAGVKKIAVVFAWGSFVGIVKWIWKSPAQ
jgi:hypothetical protein